MKRNLRGEMFILIVGILLLGACEKKSEVGVEVIEERNGDLYTLTIGRESKIFDLSKVEDRMRLTKFQEKHREALEEHQRQQELQAQQQEELYREDKQGTRSDAGPGEGVLRSNP